jgi:calcineurin-like phosphoesterase
MCGESGGILGMNAECVVTRMRTRLPEKFVLASGEPIANGAVFTLDTSSGKVTEVERISF